MTARDMVRGGGDIAKLPLSRRLLFELPWYLVIPPLKLLYHFRVEGRERLPRHGPFILALNEYSPLAFLISGWIAVTAVKEIANQGGQVMSFMRGELFETGFFRAALDSTAPGKYAALSPQNAGKLALSLLEAYRALESGGAVVLNPEGDMPWDGRPLPLGPALAWLGLHTAAPIVPAIVDIGAYDIWPRWQSRPNLSGRVTLKIGEPFQLSQSSRTQLTDEEVAAAQQRLSACFDELRYGAGGINGWKGEPARDGHALSMPGKAEPASRANARAQGTPLWQRGMALLLWRCPICGAEESVEHRRSLRGEQTVHCAACDAKWKIQRIPGKDFRLRVVSGPREWVGVEMALSAWYDEMKRGFSPVPIAFNAATFDADERVLLTAGGADLFALKTNRIFEENPADQDPKGFQNTSGLSGDSIARAREAPREHMSLSAEWRQVGQGRLILTNCRLIWQGATGAWYWKWERVSSIMLWLMNSITIQYGAVPYRLELGHENGLKWLTYLGTAARSAAAQTGARVKVSPF